VEVRTTQIGVDQRDLLAFLRQGDA